MDFNLSEEQRVVQESAREFRKRYIDPMDSADWKEPDPAKRFPWKVLRASHEYGLKGLMAPVEDGGCGGDPISIFLAGEEVGYGDYSLASILGHQWLFSKLLTANANEEQKKKFLEPFYKQPDYLLSASITEDESGSDNLVPYNDPKVGPVTSAVREGDEWVINGKKQFTTGGAESKLNILWARTDKTKGIFEGLTCILVPMDTQGITIGDRFDKLGDRFSTNCPIYFDNVRVPVENTLGEVNKGLYCFGPVETDGYLTNVSAPAIGVARAAYDVALDWCKNRVGGGTPIINHALVGRELVEMKLMIENGRNLALKAAWAIGNQRPLDHTLPMMSKIYNSDMCANVVRKAFELFGGYAIVRPIRIEKLYRDATTLFHEDGTIMITMMKVWNNIRGVSYMTV